MRCLNRTKAKYMKEHFQSRFIGGSISAPTNGVARIDVPFASKIKYMSVKTGVNLDLSPPDTGSSFWNVTQNGTSLFTGTEFEIGSTNNFDDKTALDIDAAKDDVLLLDLTIKTQTSNVLTPIIWQVVFDDEAGTECLAGGTTGQALVKASDDDNDVAWDDVSSDIDIDSQTEKTTPVGGDILLIEDSEDSFTKKKIQIANLPSSGGGSDFAPITKTGNTGGTISGDIWTKTAVNAWGNCGFGSVESIIDGRMRFVVSELTTTRSLGFKTSNSNNNYSTITYGIFIGAGGLYYLNLTGSLTSSTAFSQGDIFILELSRDEFGKRYFKIYKNGALTHGQPLNSGTTDVTPYFVVATANENGAKLGVIKLKSD